MVEKFKKIFAGLDYAYGNFKKETSNIPSKKVEGKSTVIRKPVTDELWKNHLEGVGLRLGIFPVTAEGTCRWGLRSPLKKDSSRKIASYNVSF